MVAVPSADHRCYLLANGEQVFHILGPGKVTMASQTPGSYPGRDSLTYPPSQP